MANEIRDLMLAALRPYERRDRSSGSTRQRGRVSRAAVAAQALADSLAAAARVDERQIAAAELTARAATVRAAGGLDAEAIATELEAAAVDVAAGPQPVRGVGHDRDRVR